MALAIPTYIMGVFSLSVGFCNHIECLISRLWWGIKYGERKTHWMNWNCYVRLSRNGFQEF